MALDGYEQAIKVLDRVIDIDVNFAEGHYWLGRINYIQERFEVAAPSFLTAVSLAPEWSGAYAELGLCYFRMHKYTEAEKAFLEAFRLSSSTVNYSFQCLPPNFSSSDEQWEHKVSSLLPANMLYYLGLISFERGLFEKSEGYYLKGIELDPDFADLHFQLGLCTKEKWKFAEESFLETVRLNTQMAQAHYQLSLLYFKRGKHQEAKQKMEISQRFNKTLEERLDQQVALMRNEDKAPVSSHLGRMNLNDQKYEAAIRDYRKAIWHNPNLTEAYNGLGYAYALQGKWELALGAQEQALQLNPQMPEAYSGIGMVWFRKAEISGNIADYEGALTAYQKAISLKIDFPEALANIANIKMKLHHFEDAELDYKKLLSLQPENPKIRLALAAVCFQQQKYGQAEAHYHKLL